ncbi:MAG: ketoacyl-ACP synthase III [Xanthomonadales bacterium]|nr:ketoacyl-ACP synthase III [Xanthomonadales bacterium]
MRMKNALITGWGKCTPPARLTNEHLATFLDTSDEWITSRTGIKERRISHVTLSEMAEAAARHAMAAAGIEASDVDVLILATASGDTVIPSSAARLQGLLGADKAAVMDLNSACTGFVYGLGVARSMIRSGDAQTVLLVGADLLTWYVDWMQRESAVLFGDAAGAVVIQASDEGNGIVASKLGCDAKGNEILKVCEFGTGMDRFNGPKGRFPIQFDGREIFKRAVVGMGRASSAVLDAAGWDKSDLDLVIPHQANLRIIESLAHKLDMPPEKVVVNIERYGNTSAGTIPVALAEALEQGRIRPGDRILMAAFGAGLTWGAAALEWGNRVEPVAVSDFELPPCDKTGLELIADAIDHCRSLQSA